MAFDALRSPVCSGRPFIALGRWLICTVFVYAAAGAGAQNAPFQQLPEFETWIQEADNSKMDPVDFVQALRAAGSVTSAQSRSFNKYVLARTDAKGAELVARINAEGAELLARINAEGAELLAQRVAENAKLDAELLKITKLVLAVMKTLETQGRLGADAVADLNKMANSGSEEVRVMVRREFGKYIKP